MPMPSPSRARACGCAAFLDMLLICSRKAVRLQPRRARHGAGERAARDCRHAEQHAGWPAFSISAHDVTSPLQPIFSRSFLAAAFHHTRQFRLHRAENTPYLSAKCQRAIARRFIFTFIYNVSEDICWLIRLLQQYGMSMAGRGRKYAIMMPPQCAMRMAAGDSG